MASKTNALKVFILGSSRRFDSGRENITQISLINNRNHLGMFGVSVWVKRLKEEENVFEQPEVVVFDDSFKLVDESVIFTFKPESRRLKLLMNHQ